MPDTAVLNAPTKRSGSEGPSAAQPSHEDIALRAREIWESRGCPDGSAERDWLEAEEQLRAAETSRITQQKKPDKSGSVQR